MLSCLDQKGFVFLILYMIDKTALYFSLYSINKNII